MTEASNASLIKFCNINTALKILNSQSLRWSAPHLYNDPFEPNYFSDTDFTAEQLLKGISQEALAVLFGEAEPPGNNKLVTTIQRWKQENRFESEQEAEPVLKQLLLPMAQQQQVAVNDYLQRWRQFAQNIRICCFCDSVENIRGWQRYANNHQGIALKFDTSESMLNPSFKVNYADHPIAATSLTEQVNIAFGRSTPPSQEDLLRLLRHKPLTDKDVREIRCFNTEKTEAESDDQLWYNAKTFEAVNLSAVYLGINIDKSDKKLISKLVEKAYPHCRIYQSELASNSYNLSFTRLNKP